MAERLPAEEVRERIHDGAMLVCAYDDVDKCRQFGIEEAVPYPELKNKLDTIPRAQELVFFCA